MVNKNLEFANQTSAIKNPEEQFFDEMATSTIPQYLASLYLNEKFSDVTFVVDGHKFYAHKVILGRSKYFESLLFGNLKEASQSEITISDVSVNVFKKLLKFMYTDRITVVSANADLALNVLDLANKFCINDLEKQVVENLIHLVNSENVCHIIQRAEMYNLTELLDFCLSFLDEHASEFLKTEGFNSQPEEVLLRVLTRDSFRAPEVDIFTAIVQWCQVNKQTNIKLLNCVRLSSMDFEEIYSVVKPTKLIDNEVLIEAIAELNGTKPKTATTRCISLLNVNVASVQQKAQIVNNQNTDLSFVLNGNKVNTKFASFPLNATKSFEVKLAAPACVNNINILFHKGSEARYYCYYIESSMNGTTWNRIVDYTDYNCRALQELYFEKKIVYYLRVVGTQSTSNNLNIVSFEAMFKDVIPKLKNGIICPPSNVALLTKGAVVIEGASTTGGGMFHEGDVSSSYHYHRVGEGCILIQLAQPYIIDTIMLLLLDEGTYDFRYYIEASSNKVDWTIIADKSNEHCNSWQRLNFEAQPVVYIKITGTYASDDDRLYCHYFECFASEKVLGQDY